MDKTCWTEFFQGVNGGGEVGVKEKTIDTPLSNL